MGVGVDCVVSELQYMMKGNMAVACSKYVFDDFGLCVVFSLKFFEGQYSSVGVVLELR